MAWDQALMLLPGLVIGLTVHEFAHAWSASLLGDDFPRRQGRVSLNPLRHLSPLGTLAIFLLPFGWGKPVMVNLYNFKHPKRDYLLTSLAGPLANVVVAAACIGLMHLASHPYRFPLGAQAVVNWSYVMLSLVVVINVMLAVFNLIPIPPLDGSKIWPCLIPGAKPTMSPKLTWTFGIILIVLLSTHSLRGVAALAMDGVLVLLPRSDAETFARLQEQGEAAYEQEKYHDAQRLFTEALAINPWSDSCHHWRACAKWYQSDWAGALEDLDRAIELEPADPNTHEFRAEALTKLGKNGDAAAERAMAKELRKAATAATQPRPR